MKLLKAKADNQKKIILEISKIHYIKSMTPLPELLEGEEMQNPIEVRQHSYSLQPRKGVNEYVCFLTSMGFCISSPSNSSGKGVIDLI